MSQKYVIVSLDEKESTKSKVNNQLDKVLVLFTNVCYLRDSSNP